MIIVVPSCLKDADGARTRSDQNEKMKSLFPINKTSHPMKTRKQRMFHTKKNNTKRWKKSALPYMTKLMNDENEKKNEILKNT